VVRRALAVVLSASALVALVAGAACGSFSDDSSPAATDGAVAVDGGPASDAASGAASDAFVAKPPSASAFRCGSVSPSDFCDDFERTELLEPAKGWTAGAGATVPTIASDVFSSMTRSLKAVTPPDDAGGFYGSITRAIDSSKRRVEVSFSMRLDEAPPHDMQYVAFTFATAYVFLVGSSQYGFRIGEQDLTSVVYNDKLIGVPPMNTFVRYMLVVDVDNQLVTLTTDQPNLGGSLALTLKEHAPTALDIGDVYSSAESTDTAVFAWFDDVVSR
jgi:hypothetical protein